MRRRDLRVTMPAIDPWQSEIVHTKARFTWVSAGRRSAKSHTGIVKATVGALRGEPIWWVAPTYKLTPVAWRNLKHLAKNIPGTKVSEAHKLIEYPTGGWISVRSADDPDSLVSEGLGGLVVDEAARIVERAWTENLSQTLIDRQGWALFLSTPRGRDWFYRGCMAAKTDPDSAYFHRSTLDSPWVPQAEKELLVRRYAEGRISERAWRQEILAEFLEDAGYVFRHVREQATAERQEGPISGHEYVFGVDWAEGGDATVFAVLDTTLKAIVRIDAFRSSDYEMQVGRLHALYQVFRPLRIFAEKNSMGGPLVQQLYRENLPVSPFLTSNASKDEAVRALALAYERREITTIPDEDYILEAEAYEQTKTASGLPKYGAPDGAHDDRVTAAFIAWSATLPTAGAILL